MSNISLPESCFPAWANVIPEGEWKTKLMSQISGDDDAKNDNAVGVSELVSTSKTADESCRHDAQHS